MGPMSYARAFLLLHGFGNHRPPEHWMHWLTQRLEAAGHCVLYPQLPDPDHARLEAWQITLTEQLEQLTSPGDDPPGERIVICHSLSCLLWFHTAPRLDPAHRPDRLLLVSPPGIGWIPDPAVGFDLDTIDADALRVSASREVRIVCSDADPYNPPGTPETYGQPLGLPCDVIAGGGHISSDDGYGPWPGMLAWCEAPGGPVGRG
jgi:predicted alpha/beta hydrolase family esterase